MAMDAGCRGLPVHHGPVPVRMHFWKDVANDDIHVPQRTANFDSSNKDRRNRPHAAEFLLGSVSSTVPENRSVVS